MSDSSDQTSQHSAGAPQGQGDVTDEGNADARDGRSGANAEKDPSQWVTGGEPPTGPQLSYLSTLAREAGEPAPDPDSLTKAEASENIERLQEETGRGSGT